MNPNDFREKLRLLLSSEEPAPAEQPVELATLTLEDGSIIEAESFESGNMVAIIKDGERLPLPIGEHKLEDDRILVVAEEGVIAEIKEAKEDEPEEAELSIAEVGEALLKIADRVKSLEEAQELSKQEAEKAKAELEASEEAKAAIEKEVEGLREQVVNLKAAEEKKPAAKPQKGNAVNLASNKRMIMQSAGSTKDNIARAYENL